MYILYFLIRAGASPPPHSGNARKKTFFLEEERRCSLRYTVNYFLRDYLGIFPNCRVGDAIASKKTVKKGDIVPFQRPLQEVPIIHFGGVILCGGPSPSPQNLTKLFSTQSLFWERPLPQDKLHELMFVEGYMKWCDRVDGEHLNAESEESTIEESVEQKHLTCRQTD